jgi:hypothetical protein
MEIIKKISCICLFKNQASTYMTLDACSCDEQLQPAVDALEAELFNEVLALCFSVVGDSN